jgi:hypothetical protein
MFILNWLPDFVFHLILITGILAVIASLVLKMVPFVDQYRVPLQIIGIILTCVGIWYEGGIAKDNEYRKAILEMKLQVAESDKKAAEATGRVEIVIRDKVKVVHDTKVVIQEKIINMADYIDAKCKITPEAAGIHNQSAKRPVVGVDK